MPKNYEIDEKTAEVKEVFTPDPEDDTRVKDYCPLCIEGGPYLLIYGKDEAGFPVKKCPQCKIIIPMHVTGRIDTDITTSQSHKGKVMFTGMKLSEITKRNKNDPFSDTDQANFFK